MRTIEDILKEATDKRLMLANLFQLRTYPANKNVPCRPTGEWQANFHHSTGWHDYGRGMSPQDALEDALARAKGEKGADNRPLNPIKRSAEGEVDAPVVKDVSLDDML